MSTFYSDGWTDAYAGLAPSAPDVAVYAAEYMQGYDAAQAEASRAFDADDIAESDAMAAAEARWEDNGCQPERY